MDYIQKQKQDRKNVFRQGAHLTSAPRMEGKVRNARMNSPKKAKKGRTR